MKQILSHKGRLLRWLLCAAACFLMFYCYDMDIMAAEGTVSKDNVIIRAEASTGSEVVGSVAKGKKITIEEEAKDSSGTVWYKVAIGGNNYGYIRSDMVDKAASSGNAASSTNTATLEETVPTAISEQMAVISERSVIIRRGASIAHDAIISLPQNTEIKLIGEAEDSSGRTWYQMTASYDGNSIQGYVRSDLITLGGTPAEEITGTENNADSEGESQEPEGEDEEGGGEITDNGEAEEPDMIENSPEEEHNDYEVVYIPNENGEYEYYLYDNVSGTKTKIAVFYEYLEAKDSEGESLDKQLNTNKIIIIILAVVIIILVLIVTIMFFKIRDLYYEEDDEDDEDDEEFQDEEPVMKKTRYRQEPVAERTQDRPQDRSKNMKRQDAPARKSVEYTGAELRAASSYKGSGSPTNRQNGSPTNRQTGRPEKKTSGGKPQNFIVDDEFEFEFLNMDDKD